MNTPKTITIFARVGAQNLGDELILKNEIISFRQKYGDDTRFIVPTYDISDIFYKNKNIEYINYFPNNIKNPLKIFSNIRAYIDMKKAIKTSDIVVFGGGGIFFDSEVSIKKNPLKLWLYRARLVQKYNKKLMIYGVSIDIKQDQNLEIIKDISSIASDVYVRDNLSRLLLSNLGIRSTQILDPVYMDIGNTNFKQPIKKLKATNFKLDDIRDIDIRDMTIGLALRSGFIDDEDNIIGEMIDYLLSKNNKIILLPHSFHKTDTKSNDYLFLSKFLTDKVSITSDMRETYDVYKNKKTNLNLSMRLHSMILSGVYDIDYVAISYAKKTEMI